jgi:hypothetical protein
MKEMQFIRMAKDVVTKFAVEREWKEEHGRTWVFQIVDGLKALDLSGTGQIQVMYNPSRNKFYVTRE